MGMKEHIEQLYARKEDAERDAKLFHEEVGYDFKIVEESQNDGCGGNARKLYRLILDLPTPMMG
jgi:hypothetical protein